jgi:hypothetical protein
MQDIAKEQEDQCCGTYNRCPGLENLEKINSRVIAAGFHPRIFIGFFQRSQPGFMAGYWNELFISFL